MIKPSETPDLYLALPLEKKILRLGPTITETGFRSDQQCSRRAVQKQIRF